MCLSPCSERAIWLRAQTLKSHQVRAAHGSLNLWWCHEQKAKDCVLHQRYKQNRGRFDDHLAPNPTGAETFTKRPQKRTPSTPFFTPFPFRSLTAFNSSGRGRRRTERGRERAELGSALPATARERWESASVCGCVRSMKGSLQPLILAPVELLFPRPHYRPHAGERLGSCDFS